MANTKRKPLPSQVIMARHTYTYECGAGHWMTSKTEQKSCPAYVRGKPCTAPLVKL